MLHGVTQSVAVDSPAAQVSVFVGCAVATVHVASAKKSGREDRPAWLSHRSLHRIAQFQVGLCQSQRRNLNQSDPTRSQPVAACRPRCMPTLLNRSAIETYYRLRYSTVEGRWEGTCPIRFKNGAIQRQTVRAKGLCSSASGAVRANAVTIALVSTTMHCTFQSYTLGPQLPRHSCSQPILARPTTAALSVTALPAKATLALAGDGRVRLARQRSRPPAHHTGSHSCAATACCAAANSACCNLLRSESHSAYIGCVCSAAADWPRV
jgi:hypothetical protein